MIPANKTINMLYNVLYDQGFFKYKHSMYRCAGQGLLQVVDPVGPKSIVEENNYAYENTVLFRVYSLYGNIPWHLGIGNAPIGVPATIDSHCLLRDKSLSFSGTTKAIEIMIRHGVPFFNEISNHSQLVNALEDYDCLIMGQILPNDPHKIAPYILSGTPNKAAEVITAIEHQNWNAYYTNIKTVPNYDAARHKSKIETRLRPLLKTRDAIIQRNAQALREILEENYRVNKSLLTKLRIPVSDDCVADLDTIQI